MNLWSPKHRTGAISFELSCWSIKVNLPYELRGISVRVQINYSFLRGVLFLCTFFTLWKEHTKSNPSESYGVYTIQIMKLRCQNFFKTISFLRFYKKRHYLILNFGLLFVVVFSSFLLLAIFSSVTRLKGFIMQAIWLLIVSHHGWKSNTPEWLNYLKPHTNCIFCSPEMSSECWLSKQKFVENSNYLYCIWTFIPVLSNTAGPIWNIWSSHAKEKKSHLYINHVKRPQFRTIFNRCNMQWHLTSDDVEISCTGIVLWQQLLYCSVIYEKITQVQDQLEYNIIYINKIIHHYYSLV